MTEHKILIENEKQANFVVAKVMRITFLIFTFIYLLDLVGAFVVNLTIMTTAYVGSALLLLTPTLMVNVLKQGKNVICQPMISAIDLERYLKDLELVVVGGESDRFARPMHYEWVLSVREQCIRQNVSFEFRQCGTHFIKDRREYILQKKDLCAQARKTNINYLAVK